jgi:hypothetical protein
MSGKGLINRIYRDLKKTKLPDNQCPNEEMGKELNSFFKGKCPNG